jgi:hypothetical protein
VRNERDLSVVDEGIIQQGKAKSTFGGLGNFRAVAASAVAGPRVRNQPFWVLR